MKLTEQNKTVRSSSETAYLGARSIAGAALKLTLLALGIFFTTVASHAQTAAIYGQLGNFDVVNHSGQDGHGFEIELDGLQPNNVTYSFSYQRYGAAQITATPTGTLVRWTSTYTNGAFDQTTLPYTGGGAFGGSCYMGGANYNSAGCEHFGVSLTATPTATHYRWLIEDAANPGTLIGFNPPVAIVAPVYVIIPPAVVGEPPVLEANFEAPEPPERPDLYGDAQWVKIFKTELTREVTLDELMSDNPIVPQDAAQTEVAWEIIQTDPTVSGNTNGNRQHRGNSGTLHFDTRAVIRRYETYNYTGAYDPITHKALCADLVCSLPAAGEVGDYIGAQMGAANVAVQSLSVGKTGNGTVSSADKLINCGSKCVSGYNAAALVTLTANPSSGYVFTAWGGACSGGNLTCALTISNATNVSAIFKPVFSLSVSDSGRGSVTGSAGINCGKTCSAKVVQGADLTFTATPDAGNRFTGWSGGVCSGTSPTCTTTVTGNLNVQAVFVKQ